VVHDGPALRPAPAERAAARAALDRGVEFSLTGPFALAKPMWLPVADVTLTRTAGANRASADFVSTGAVGVGAESVDSADPGLAAKAGPQASSRYRWVTSASL